MKKLIVTIAIALSMGMTTFAQEAFTGTDGVAESGLFNLGTSFFSNGELGLFSSDYYYELDEEYEAYNYQPQNYVDNGLFGMGGGALFSNTRNGGLVLPGSHGQTDDSSAPLGSGALLVLGLGEGHYANKA